MASVLEGKEAKEIKSRRGGKGPRRKKSALSKADQKLIEMLLKDNTMHGEIEVRLQLRREEVTAAIKGYRWMQRAFKTRPKALIEIDFEDRWGEGWDGAPTEGFVLPMHAFWKIVPVEFCAWTVLHYIGRHNHDGVPPWVVEINDRIRAYPQPPPAPAPKQRRFPFQGRDGRFSFPAKEIPDLLPPVVVLRVIV